MIAKVIPTATMQIAEGFISEAVAGNVDLIATDDSGIYVRVGKKRPHGKVNHLRGEYVRGRVHTCTIDGYWSQLKRQIFGIHHWVSAKYLGRYLDENSWRYNERESGEGDRVNNLIARANGHLSYKALIA